MPDDVEGEQAEAEAGSQQAAPEATQTTEGAINDGGSTGSANPTPSWKVGDTTYTDPNEMYKGFVKWQGEYTRKMQERAAKDREITGKMGQYEAVINAIRSDENLRGMVIARMQAGQTQAQAEQGVARQMQLPPEVMEKLGKVDQLEAKEKEREYDAAINTFSQSHKDLTDDEWDQMGDYAEKNDEWLAKLPPERQITLAYAEVVLPARQQKQAMADLAAKQKGEESENGKKSAFLGSQAPTAGAKPAGLPERKRGMTPAEERAYAMKVYNLSKSKK